MLTQCTAKMIIRVLFLFDDSFIFFIFFNSNDELLCNHQMLHSVITTHRYNLVLDWALPLQRVLSLVQ